MPTEIPTPRAPVESSKPLEARPLRDKTIHELFEEQAAATPDAVAVLFEDQELRYAQLNERANRLAHHLIRRGAAPGNLIGLCMERSPEVVVGLLGILKAGGAYVPLDPAYPDERLAFMLRDTAAPLVLAHRPTAGRLAPFVRQTRILCLDADAAAVTAEPAADPDVGATADDLAYVMYTSGSTGAPKGVLVGHRAVLRLVRDTDYCHFGPGEVFLHLAPLAFDASTFEIRAPCSTGAAWRSCPPSHRPLTRWTRPSAATASRPCGSPPASSTSSSSIASRPWRRSANSWPAATCCRRRTSAGRSKRCGTAC